MLFRTHINNIFNILRYQHRCLSIRSVGKKNVIPYMPLAYKHNPIQKPLKLPNLPLFVENTNDDVNPIDVPEYKSIIGSPKKTVFAIVEILGKQYKVIENDLIMVDKLPYAVGETHSFDDILLLGSQNFTIIGRPIIPNAFLHVQVEEQTQTKKTLAFKKRRKNSSHTLTGHRAKVTILRITKISIPENWPNWCIK